MDKITYLKVYFWKIVRELFGYLLVAVGTVLMLYSDLGLNPWGILHQGISIQTPLTFGQASQALGFTIIIFCLFYKVVPGVGTIMNMYFVGKFIDMIKDIPLFVIPKSLILRLIMLFLGLVLMAFGMFFYLRENLGAGPKDGLMILLNKKTNLDIGMVRTLMELTAVFLGYIMGGKFGIGTIIVALALGPILRYIFKRFNYNTKEEVHENILETFKNILFKKGLTEK